MRSPFCANLHIYTRTHACTHHMIRARMGSHLQRNLFNFQTFNLVLIFIHAHKPHPFSNRFTCSFFLYSTLIYYVVKKETLEKKCEMNFWYRCMFFFLSHFLARTESNAPLGNKCSTICMLVDEEVKNDKITSEFDDKK